MNIGIKITSWLVGLIYKLVNNIVQSPKPYHGKKPLGKLMLAIVIHQRKLLRDTTDKGNLIQLELHFG